MAAPAALIAGYLLVTPAYSQSLVDRVQVSSAQTVQTVPDIPCRDTARGCPDLVINDNKLNSATLATRTFTASDCAVQEGQVGGTGPRRLLEFPYSTPNMGPGALIIGDPLAPENSHLFEWGACHGHYHFKKYAAYRLWTPEQFAAFEQAKADPANRDMLTDDIIAQEGLQPVVGTKRGFCVIDVSAAPEYTGQRDQMTYRACGYGTTIHGNQGISVGWADTYGKQLDGQWIDVTNVAEGDYILEVETNAQHSFAEKDFNNNSASKPVKVTKSSP
ncbi:MAG: lysyl oxidase family protein [Actinomycetota bacterium]|nr:lysyl oxidase family protein [Actinomycetota bacterium]